jgi:hypothetical protein
MATQQTVPLRNRFLPKLPPQATSQLRNQYAKLCDLLDQVGRRDPKTQEIYVDEASFRRFLREGLPHSEDKAIATLQAIPGNKLISSTTTNLEVIDWSTLVATAAQAVQPAPINDSMVGPSPSIDDIRKVAQKLVHQLPNDAFENKALYDLLTKAFGPTTASAQEQALQAQPTFYDPWGCMVNHLGFWGAVAAYTFVAICVACLAWIIASGLPLIWPIIWEALQMFGLPFGVLYVATVIVTCLLGFTPP